MGIVNGKIKMNDIVERLKREARRLSVLCGCNTEGCLTGTCTSKKLMWEAAHEIEELRNLMNAIKEKR